MPYSLLLFYICVVIFVFRGRLFASNGNIELCINRPTMNSILLLEDLNVKGMTSNIGQKTIKLVPRVAQSLNNTNRIPRRQNPNAHDDEEFVSKAHANEVNAELMMRRDLQLNKYVNKTCTHSFTFSPCSFMSKVYKILKRNRTKEITTYFNSLRYTPTGTVCEGCRAIMNPKFLFKTTVNGLLIRKFIGNTETNEIYTVENRIVL